MKYLDEFPDTDTAYEKRRWPNYWAAIRLGDVYDVADRVRKIGATDITVIPQFLAVVFLDPKINSRVRLEIEPWQNGSPGWYWYAYITRSNGFTKGALPAGQYILNRPRPRMVVRAYLDETRYERRPAPRKHVGKGNR